MGALNLCWTPDEREMEKRARVEGIRGDGDATQRERGGDQSASVTYRAESRSIHRSEKGGQQLHFSLLLQPDVIL
jgi:hypothetical protein